MEREACVCDHGLERSDLCAEIIIIIIIIIMESHKVNSIISRINHRYTVHLLLHVGIPKQKQTSYYGVYSIFGLRVPDYRTVILHREVNSKVGFGVVISKEVYRS